uniref:Uncharacterized protein n=1 Tax=Zooxanthella nutricula TaxID=1333877 RepID=A0A7S2NUF7_9DINO
MSFDFCAVNGVLKAEDVKTIVTNQLYDKFGYGFLAKEFYTHNQVFKREDFPGLLCELQKLIAAGKPAVVRKTLAVQANAWWGITPYDVDMVFVYNQKCAEFEALLPEETRTSIEQGGEGEFNHFPNFKTMFNNGARHATTLTAAQINLLAAQAEYSVLQNEAMFRDLLTHSYASVPVA